MRINALYYSKKFQSFLNTFAFIFMICCFILTILLPLPYKGEDTDSYAKDFIVEKNVTDENGDIVYTDKKDKDGNPIPKTEIDKDKSPIGYGITLEPRGEYKGPVIVCCVLIPFLTGIISFLVFKITYLKSIAEVKQEFQENISYNLIDTKTVIDWENQVESFKSGKALRKAEQDYMRKENAIKLIKMEEDIKKRIDKLNKELAEKNETKGIKQNTEKKDII